MHLLFYCSCIEMGSFKLDMAYNTIFLCNQIVPTIIDFGLGDFKGTTTL